MPAERMTSLFAKITYSFPPDETATPVAVFSSLNKILVARDRKYTTICVFSFALGTDGR
jgi:hypothetical protein